MNESTANKILQVIDRQPEGTLFFPEDFGDLGSPENVRKALERLKNRQKITRVAQGIYARPKQNAYIGSILPSAEEVAAAIAKRDRARTLATGSTALNALGLSTQVPMNIILLTDGTARTVKVGKRTIKFKKTTPRNLAMKGAISSLVIQGLKAVGKGKLSDSDEQKLLTLLRQEKHEDLLHDIRLAPMWVQQIMKKAL
ncbi:MAG TPA: DUF6088 family protein [Puia sp.]|jgi:hypothetical protein|nr:DUF6088 family protein [Puia sp.]